MISLVGAIAWRLGIFFAICYGANEYVSYVNRKEQEHAE